ncbi:methionyl-tRNA formyltransferase [Aggregatimonas sangjinii]|uniref:Methionyl-tRNA formyltransferase n=1 Tax=Aggregatimonas sangjinii TaxID=2583587 RepID=A0A5B7SRT2_9FLAO|nr:methionyl-tRNA formyltransferase [Aggregatimonas sangjinii]QCW99710.1 methionyl-tRNA formyltransferase [Aggregatimonas sangjinii]
MRDLRIVFMGTPDFAVTTLAALLNEGHPIVGVITAPDRPAGRGRKLRPSAVKQFALENGLHLMQPTNLKNEDFLNELRALQANLQIVVAFRMLPKQVWAMPEYGTFNLHASLLPDYRGAAPINWAIINGDSMTGVTTFFIDDKIDTGEIILQKAVPITEEDSAGTLHDRLMHQGAALVLRTVQLIKEDKAKTTPQDPGKERRPAHKIYTETCQINWQSTLEEIHNLVRGLSPYPVAWSNFVNGEDEGTIKIYKTSVEKVKHKETIGALIGEAHSLKVAAPSGYLHLLEIQLSGKRKMATKDLLNGYQFEKNARMV